jgi:hypothetical protein
MPISAALARPDVDPRPVEAIFDHGGLQDPRKPPRTGPSKERRRR